MMNAPPILPVSTPLRVVIHLLRHAPLVIVKHKGLITGVVTIGSPLKVL